MEPAPTPKPSSKPSFAELKAQKRQELKEYKESQLDDGWTVVKPKKGKAEEINVAALVAEAKANLNLDTKTQTTTKKAKKEKSNENSGNNNNAKEIKNRVNNELKKEENIKAVIDEIEGKSNGKFV